MTLLKEANMIDDIKAKISAGIFGEVVVFNNFFNMKYMKIVIKTYIIIFKIIPGQTET